MAQLHILQQTANNRYEVVVHAPTPIGTNSALVPWSTALVNSGLAVTSMPSGNGAGQISVAEANQVTSGNLIEARFQWDDNPAWSEPERLTDLALRAAQALQSVTDDYTARLKQFGRIVA